MGYAMLLIVKWLYYRKDVINSLRSFHFVSCCCNKGEYGMFGDRIIVILQSVLLFFPGFYYRREGRVNSVVLAFYDT